ncbi:MAG: tetratricopeptide repeat protein [Candidatus Omnitrophica bacterium]|nr:tetratricopeptide repeat protein [Candidatus Omnitrophota bacterium]
MAGVLFAFSLLTLGFAQEQPAEKPSSGELINNSWAVHGKRDVEATFQVTQQLIDLYKDQADKEQASLSALPKAKDEINKVAVLNDVATAYFIQAESFMRQQKLEEAKKIFKMLIDKYFYAQAWDPRGWYWQIAEASKQSIKKMESGSIELEAVKKVSQLPTKVVLYEPGKEDFIDYSKYGEFKNLGTDKYEYVVKDQEGLSIAVGEGIYPNTTSVRWDPELKKAQKEKRLEGSHWDFVHSPDLEAAFLKWATGSEPQGVRLFYIGLILEKSGMIKEAIKAYYAIVVHYPGAYGWTYFKTPWYVGQAAIAKINYLLRKNPQLGYKLADADIRIKNGYDNNVANDTVIASPGRFVKVTLMEKLKAKPSKELLSIKKRSGKGRVYVLQYETGDWELMVDGKPFALKAVTYSPTKVGESPDDGTQSNWMEQDINKNGKADGPYDSFVDRNRNNVQDQDEPAVGDFALMKDMGVNAIRLYHHPNKVNKEVLRDLYKNYGIMVIMGDFLGKYALGSGAQWNPGTDYNNEEHKKNMMDSVTKMVEEFKDEPYVLFWLLGNENVYGYACNADTQPEAFFKLANEAAVKIKSIDPDHPVAICSGDILYLDKFGKNAPDIDIFGANAYRGNYGFGFFWREVKEEADKPAFITEYGCPAYFEGKSVEEGEEAQADYHRGSWDDIENNMAFGEGAGNAIGSVAFEWLDEWWKAYEPAIHDKKGSWVGPFPDGTMHEEWLGLIGQGDGSLSPFLRQLRKAYSYYKKTWKK